MTSFNLSYCLKAPTSEDRRVGVGVLPFTFGRDTGIQSMGWCGGIESVCLQGQQGEAGSFCMAEGLSLPGNKYGLSPACRHPHPTAPEPLTCSAISPNWVTTLPYSLHSLSLKPIPSPMESWTNHTACAGTYSTWRPHLGTDRSVSCSPDKCGSHWLLPPSPQENVGVRSHHHPSFPSCPCPDPVTSERASRNA